MTSNPATDRVEILLVEDNPSDAELARMALKRHNLADHILWVHDGAEALDYFFEPEPMSRPRPKVILLDLKMPRVDGMEVLARLKGDARTQQIPVVVFTSSREERDLVTCYRLGANSYILKAMDFDEFSKALGQVGAYWLKLNELPQNGNHLG